MSDHDLPELPPDVAALLDAARDVPAAPAAERRRVASRLALTTGLSVPGASLAKAAAGAWLAKALGVALVVAAGGAALTARRHEPAPRARTAATASQAAAAPATTAAPPPTAAAPPRVTTAPSPTTAAPATATAAPAVAARRAPPAPDGDLALDGELALLERAHASLARGAAGEAAEALDAHARRFPRGRLEPEREALRVECAVARGDRGAAEAARGRFHRRFPGSVLGAAVDRSVEALP